MLHGKTYKLSNIPNIRTEGKAISLLQVRLSNDQLEKLNEILQKLGIEPLKDGDDRSEKLRNFVDKLYSELIGNSKEEFLHSIHKNNPPTESISKPFRDCIYYASPKDGIVNCQKDFTKKGKTYTLTEAECLTCWKRRSYVVTHKTELGTRTFQGRIGHDQYGHEIRYSVGSVIR